MAQLKLPDAMRPTKDNEWVYNEPNVHTKIAGTLLKHWPKNKHLLVLCIGTDAVVGDAVGPLVGTWLKDQGICSAGTLEVGLNAQTLEAVMEKLKAAEGYSNMWTLAVDASLSSKPRGTIWFEPRPCEPGWGAGNYLSPVGDASICVSVGAPSLSGREKEHIAQNQFTLQTVPLSPVYYSASAVFYGIWTAAQKREGELAKASVAQVVTV